MLAKAREEGVDWAQFLPMALFAIRQVPNRDTGYSPHELVFGTKMRGPLNLVYAGWLGDEEMTTIGCPAGKFKFKRMPFGLKKPPAIFQAVVEEVLRSVSDVSVNYVDDVLVFTKTWEQHPGH